MRLAASIFVLLLASSVCGQTVTKVIDGVTVALDSGNIVKLKDCKLSASPALQEKAKQMLQYLVLDRPVELLEITDEVWGQQEAVITWRKKDIGDYMRRHGYVLGPQSQVRSQPVRVIEQPPARIVYPQQRVYPPLNWGSSYTQPSYAPSYQYSGNTAYCVGST